MRNAKLPVLFLVTAAIVTPFIAALSLNSPRLLGKERLWNLNAGVYIDRVFFCGIKISERNVKSGLETLFDEQIRTGQTSFPHVVIYSNSIFQPSRGGQWMRIAHLAGRFVASSTNLAPLDRQRLVSLIRAQDDTELLRWFYERERAR
jgi:hypothetical protein